MAMRHWLERVAIRGVRVNRVGTLPATRPSPVQPCSRDADVLGFAQIQVSEAPENLAPHRVDWLERDDSLAGRWHAEEDKESASVGSTDAVALVCAKRYARANSGAAIPSTRDSAYTRWSRGADCAWGNSDDTYEG